MAADPVPAEVLAEQARAAALTRPRPGHADLVGMQKYGFDDARPVLERASARETAARVALGAVAAAFLDQAAGVALVSHTVAVGPVAVPEGAPLPLPADVGALDADPVRCHDAGDERPDGGGDRRLPPGRRHPGRRRGGRRLRPAAGARAATSTGTAASTPGSPAALMGIQAIKGVEVGDGFRTAARRGSAAHDEIERGADGTLRRRTGRAGGTEGGMSTGEVAAGAGRDEADLDRSARAGHRRRRHRASRPSRSTSAPTCARCRRPAWWPRRWSRSCSPTPSWRSSAATACAETAPQPPRLPRRPARAAARRGRRPRRPR